MPAPAPIIAIVGVDGAGKSTQAAGLAADLRAGGRKARSFENPGGRPLVNAIAHRLGRPDGRALLGPNLIVVIETIIRCVAIARALAWSRATGGIPIMDRYAYCQYAMVRSRGDRGERFARFILGWCPPPDLTCVLMLPADVAQRRVEERGKDHEELTHLLRFAQAYRSLPEWPTFHVVDAAGDSGEVRAALRDEVDAVLLSHSRSDVGTAADPRG